MHVDLREARGIILAYDVTSNDSFANIRWWFQACAFYAPKSTILLVGTKCDSDKREIKTEQGQSLAQELGIMFIETSAKLNINIQKAFDFVLRGILEKQQP